MIDGVEPLDQQEVDFALLVEDQVNEVAGLVRAEGPTPHRAGGVVLVVGSTDDGSMLPATDYFRAMGGYLISS